MTTEDNGLKEPKDRDSGETPSIEQEGKPPAGEGQSIEQNPDVEDPRLYSPLQAPDTPPLEERAVDKPQVEEEKDPPSTGE